MKILRDRSSGVRWWVRNGHASDFYSCVWWCNEQAQCASLLSEKINHLTIDNYILPWVNLFSSFPYLQRTRWHIILKNVIWKKCAATLKNLPRKLNGMISTAFAFASAKFFSEAIRCHIKHLQRQRKKSPTIYALLCPFVFVQSLAFLLFLDSSSPISLSTRASFESFFTNRCSRHFSLCCRPNIHILLKLFNTLRHMHAFIIWLFYFYAK